MVLCFIIELPGWSERIGAGIGLHMTDRDRKIIW